MFLEKKRELFSRLLHNKIQRDLKLITKIFRVIYSPLIKKRVMNKDAVGLSHSQPEKEMQ